MAEAKTAVAVHACGLESENKICKAFESRLDRMYELVRSLHAPKTDAIIIIAGGGICKNDSFLLVHYVVDHFKKVSPERHSPYSVFYAVDGYNSSTDTRDVLKTCRHEGVEKLIVVTSYWHNWMVRQMYSRFNNDPDLTVEFASPASRDGAGPKTIIKYAVAGLIVLAARLTGQFNRLDKFLNKKQEIRRKEFRETGCD